VRNQQAYHQSVSSRLPHLITYRFATLIALLVCICCPSLHAQTPDTLEMQQTYQNLRSRLAQSPLRRGLVLDSTESPDRTSGDIYAVMDVALPRLELISRDPARWCEILLLLSNSKNCTTGVDMASPVLLLQMGTKGPQDLSSTTAMDFRFSSAKAHAPVLETLLSADSGPMGTKDGTMRLRAIALPSDQAFIHLHYSYRSSMSGRFATEVYLQTLGRGKVGFSADAGRTNFVGGVRGIIERNTMRYFIGLGCASQFATTDVAAQRFGQMAACWYDETQRYPVQLYEMPRADYLDMKRAEYARPAAKR
jgi:hypothetical protein